MFASPTSSIWQYWSTSSCLHPISSFCLLSRHRQHRSVIRHHVYIVPLISGYVVDIVNITMLTDIVFTSGVQRTLLSRLLRLHRNVSQHYIDIVSTPYPHLSRLLCRHRRYRNVDGHRDDIVPISYFCFVYIVKSLKSRCWSTSYMYLHSSPSFLFLLFCYCDVDNVNVNKILQRLLIQYRFNVAMSFMSTSLTSKEVTL